MRRRAASKDTVKRENDGDGDSEPTRNSLFSVGDRIEANWEGRGQWCVRCGSL